MKKTLCILTLLFTLSLTLAQDVVVTLQNGSQGYSGCTDSYIHKQVDSDTYEKTNYGNENNVDIYNCPT